MISRSVILRNAGALVVGFSLGGPLAARGASAAGDGSGAWSLDPTRADSWIRIARTGRVSAYSGKVDTGAGLRTAFVQIIADELDVNVDRITVVMADTALTPDQDKSVGSKGISIGVQPLRVAAAEARIALVNLGAPVCQERARRDAVGEMMVGPSEPLYWKRLQTTGCG